MKTPEQLKGAIRNMANKKKIRAQEVLQMYLFERMLERLAQSPYRSNFILKGGLLISAMIGIGERTTMDMDTTVRGIPMEEKEIVKIIQEILSVNIDDGISFDYKKIEPIHDDPVYNNYRVHIIASYGKINAPLKIDITTGDEITPSAIQYNYPLLFEDKTIPLMAYTLETILAEKYETIIRRNIGTTRARDFYDLYTLWRQHNDEVRIDILRKAIKATSEKRHSVNELAEWKEIIQDIREEPFLQTLWRNYAAVHPYAAEISFEDVVNCVELIAQKVNL
mgnify:CR=1 FL=1